MQASDFADIDVCRPLLVDEDSDVATAYEAAEETVTTENGDVAECLGNC